MNDQFDYERMFKDIESALRKDVFFKYTDFFNDKQNRKIVKKEIKNYLYENFFCEDIKVKVKMNDEYDFSFDSNNFFVDITVFLDEVYTHRIYLKDVEEEPEDDPKQSYDFESKVQSQPSRFVKITKEEYETLMNTIRTIEDREFIKEVKKDKDVTYYQIVNITDNGIFSNSTLFECTDDSYIHIIIDYINIMSETLDLKNLFVIEWIDRENGFFIGSSASRFLELHIDEEEHNLENFQNIEEFIEKYGEIIKSNRKIHNEVKNQGNENLKDSVIEILKERIQNNPEQFKVNKFDTAGTSENYTLNHLLSMLNNE